MTCWRCGRVEHSAWCSDGTPNDCTHCGGNPCRWWCLGPDAVFTGMNPGGSFRWHPRRSAHVMEPA